ncbi:MAG: hypothetical protein MUO26_05840 [Methanotrichaceae archaeon]|nr:hypothetical protein [Methanotrichaceae archaeon]
MVQMPRSASLGLAVIIFIILNINLCDLVLAQASSSADPLYEMKMYHSNFINRINLPTENNDNLGILLEMMKPSELWASKFGKKSDFVLAQDMQSNDKIILNQSTPQKIVQDLTAINCIDNRNIIYEDLQTNETKKANFVDIQVRGMPRDNKNVFENDYALERFVENAVESGLKKSDGQYKPDGNSAFLDKNPGNYLNIEVTGITVTAINNVPGGSAVANSDIIIKPVQIINYLSEVQEKLD